MLANRRLNRVVPNGHRDRKIVRCPVHVLFSTVFLGGQGGHRDPTPEDRNPSPDRLMVAQKIVPVQIRKDTEEFVQLTKTVTAEVQQAAKGVLNKDLKDKLKQIEKLSKRLGMGSC